AVAHRRDQRVDDFILDEISQVARRDRPGKPPPAILDLLVPGERVGDQRKGPRVFAQHFANSQCSLAANLWIAVGEEVERLGFGQLLTTDRESEVGDGFVEEAWPGGPRRHM